MEIFGRKRISTWWHWAVCCAAPSKSWRDVGICWQRQCFSGRAEWKVEVEGRTGSVLLGTLSVEIDVSVSRGG